MSLIDPRVGFGFGLGLMFGSVAMLLIALLTFRPDHARMVRYLMAEAQRLDSCIEVRVLSASAPTQVFCPFGARYSPK